MNEKQSQPHCIGCGYILNRLPRGCCPECGRPFDPHDPDTWSMGRRRAALRRFLERPIAVWDCILILSASATSVYAYLPPGLFMRAAGLSVMLWVAALGLWFLRIAMRLMYAAPARPSLARLCVGVAIAPACLSACIWANVTKAPLRLAFHMFEAQFDAAAGVGSRTPLWIRPVVRDVGPFRLRLGNVSMSGVMPFFVEGDFRDLSRHFVFVPDQALAWAETNPGRNERRVRLSHNWFLWSRDSD